MIGGDFYDFFLLDEDHLAMVVADVSGKGIPAALFMMQSKTVIRSLAQTAQSPKDILIGANAALSKDNREDMFVTVWLGILEISTGKLTFADAGHERLALYHEKNWWLLDKKNKGIALGMVEPVELSELPDMYQITDQEICLTPGDVIFQYTDGVTEATDSAEHLFGKQRMLEVLKCAPDHTSEPLL